MRWHTSPASSALAAVRLAAPAVAAVQRFDLDIVNAQLAPNGFSRPTVVANGGFPGPLITGNIGDQFLINTTVSTTDTTMLRATSIHWHGLFQAHTNEMDGPAFVNQCPIIPEHSFLYNFSVPGQAGTFWYHSHYSTQYCDGLRGAFVIYDPNDPLANMYDIDDASTVITLADWYNQIAPDLFPNHGNATPIPDSTLINGLGRSSAGGDLAVVRAQPGKRHRFRLINTGCFPPYQFSIDNHRMTIIEADGIEHEPLTVDQLEIHVAQRYSIIVTADQPVGNYWIRAIPVFPTESKLQGTPGGINSAILRYDGAPDEEPTTSAQAKPVVMNEADLHPLINPGAPGPPVPGGADVNLRLQVGRSHAEFNINGNTFVPPSVPVLLQILSGTTDARQLMPQGNVIGLPPNKSIEIVVPGRNFHHPFHLHGHAFDVIRVAGSKTYNFANPVRRDVVQTGQGGDEVTFRFFTDNPGPWFLHCHIDWHLENGLAVVLAEDPGDTAAADPPGVDWQQLCPLYDGNNPDTSILAHG
ncbi:laccase [Fomitiporia mediterranea MF3/22]|uniref:laccase n=1 Tax=Fomitiporia mediterranea (strain MF3/22) TaxID=694068 RepID=UPI0004409979|nr:laccase [Fomitiporia mediterranea MF3/22]EJD05393.1 laccase [Fomitiporia mediterranea MF3/22]